MYKLVITILSTISLLSCSKKEGVKQSLPDVSFGSPIEVTINGYSDHAMEPFISPDGQYLFFNDLNEGGDTKLHYSTRVNDFTFNYVGELNGTKTPASPRLDAVADMDVNNYFIWTSGRDYPAEFDNLHYGNFSNGQVTNIGRLRGDFYIYSQGWILMDHGLSPDGQFLYFNNARFDGDNCAGPCETKIGIAEKMNSSTFMTIPDSDEIMKNINNQAYKYYAPCVTADGLEFYYTRFLQGSIDANSISEICVAVRASLSDTFSEPKVLFSDKLITSIVEAPSLTTDKQIMYYHQKVDGVFKLMMRERL